jgi:hypothetical protein
VQSLSGWGCFGGPGASCRSIMLPPDDAPGEARRSAAHMHGHGPGANLSQGDGALLPLCSALSSRVVAACLADRPNEPISHGHQGTRPIYGAPGRPGSLPVRCCGVERSRMLGSQDRRSGGRRSARRSMPATAISQCAALAATLTKPLPWTSRRPKAMPVHELERYMRCKDCSQVRG